MRTHRGAPLDNKDNKEDVTRGVDLDHAALRTARPREHRSPKRRDVRIRIRAINNGIPRRARASTGARRAHGAQRTR